MTSFDRHLSVYSLSGTSFCTLDSDNELPGDEEVEHSQRHEGDTDVEGHAHRSVLLEDFLQLLRLVWFSSFWLRLPKGKKKKRKNKSKR